MKDVIAALFGFGMAINTCGSITLLAVRFSCAS